MTSPGECEYRNGHPSATSTDPYRKNTEPSFPPPVTPYCAGMPFSFASATTRSTYCTGTIFELSTARTTNPLPISASANRFDSSGESELTNVSTANTKSGVLPSFAACSANAAAPFNPTSSSVDHTKVTSRPGRSGPSAFTAATKAAQPTRSSKLRAFARVPSSGRYSFGIVTKSPSAIPNLAVSSLLFVPTYTRAGSSIALGPLGHSNPSLSHPEGNSSTPPTLLLSFLCTSTTCPRKYCWYPPPSTSTCSRPSSSIFFTSYPISSVCATNAIRGVFSFLFSSPTCSTRFPATSVVVSFLAHAGRLFNTTFLTASSCPLAPYTPVSA